MRRIAIICPVAAALVLLLCTASCLKEPQAEISLSAQSAGLDSGGGKLELTVTASHSWTCNTGTSDIVFSSKKGDAGSTQITIEVPGNPREEERTIEVKFNCESAKTVLTIVQTGSRVRRHKHNARSPELLPATV